MDYVIAIRSFKRAKGLAAKTMKMLREYELENKAYIFVADEQEHQIYSQAFPDIKIEIGEVGCANANKAICNFFPEEKPIVFMDDDLDGFYELEGKKLVKGNLDLLLKNGFSQGLPFTVGFMTNTMWMSNKPWIAETPAKLNGSFFAMRNNPSLCIIPNDDSHNEDVIRTCKVLNHFGAIRVYNHASFKTKYGLNDGGFTKEDRNDTLSICNREWEQYKKENIQIYFKEPRYNSKVDLWDFQMRALPTIRRLLANQKKQELENHGDL